MSSTLVTKVQPVVIKSIGDMLEYLVTYGADRGRILWYRGHRVAGWDVEPTICRGFDRYDERNFCHRFRSRAAIRTVSSPAFDDLAHWLSLMRHYGLPTRLIDWSRSPMVGLYFALEYLLEKPDAVAEDGVIWVLEPHSLNKIENVEGVGELTPSIVSGTCFNAIKGAFYDEEETEKVIAVMAHDVDLRIFIQQGCFTIHSSRLPLNKRDDQGSFLFPMLIPANYAPIIARQLFAAGMRKGDIYPDLTNLSAEIVETRRLFHGA